VARFLRIENTIGSGAGQSIVAYRNPAPLERAQLRHRTDGAPEARGFDRPQ